MRVLQALAAVGDASLLPSYMEKSIGTGSERLR